MTDQVTGSSKGERTAPGDHARLRDGTIAALPRAEVTQSAVHGKEPTMFARTTRATISRLLFPISTLLLLGGPVVARAESSETAPSVAKRHADAMSRGLNHEDARAATYASEQKSIAAKHAAAMDRGLNHEDARVATYAKDVAKERSPAAKHSAAMDRGLNHEDARVASYAQ